jgi:hypothetical protein
VLSHCSATDRAVGDHACPELARKGLVVALAKSDSRDSSKIQAGLLRAGLVRASIPFSIIEKSTVASSAFVALVIQGTASMTARGKPFDGPN